MQKYVSSLVILIPILFNGENIFAQSIGQKQRLIVLSDIGNEPDDMQSAIRLMLYSNTIDIEGLAASTSIHLKNRVYPEMLQKVVSAYGKARKNLLLHESGFPEEKYLNSIIKSGLPEYGMAGVGKDKDSEGSEWIIKMLEKKDERPLWITPWGGTSVLAQALWKMKETKSPEALEKVISRLRVYTISDQDDCGYWIRTKFKKLFYIASPGSYNDQTWSAINKEIKGINNDEISNKWLQKKDEIHVIGKLQDEYKASGNRIK